MKKERESNFELMRIISMFMIVMWHILIHGGLFVNENEVTLFMNRFILGLLVVHVNSLVFLTGYFNGEKTSINKKRCLKLIGEVWFYKVVILVIFLVLNLKKITEITIFEELLPLDLNNYWFINCYLVIYILSPYLNRVTKNMSEKEFFRFLGIQLLILAGIPMISGGRIIENNGSNIINFTIIYYLGSYFHKYPISQNEHFKNFSKKKLQIALICTFFLCLILNTSLNSMGREMINTGNSFFEYFGNIIMLSFLQYSNPIVIIQSCVYCLLFETFSIKSKIINFCAESIFGIYLIHDNHLLRTQIYEWVKMAREPSTIKMIGILVLSTIIIFIGCFIIETIRRMLVRGLEMVYTIVRKKKAN